MSSKYKHRASELAINATKSNPKKKYRWKNPETGDFLTAGGILFYDTSYFWAIQEAGQRGLEYNDIGGKYSIDDGDIFATIRRELYEETYGVCDILVSDVRKFVEKYGLKKVNDQRGACVYVCVCVPVSDIYNLCAISDDTFEEKFKKERDKILSQNPDANYKPIKINKIHLKEKHNYKIGYRLSVILKQLYSSRDDTTEDEKTET